MGGVNSNRFEKKNRDTRVIPGVEKTVADDEVVVTFVGRMIETKGPLLLAKVARELVAKHGNLRFVFVGGGELLDKLRKHETDRISFLGEMDGSGVLQVLQNSDVVVHPSTHHEGFPVVLLESGAAECAVVVTDRGGVTELVEDEVNGLVVGASEESVKSGIERLVSDEKLRHKLGRNLRKTVEQEFDWKVICEKYGKYLMSWVG